MFFVIYFSIVIIFFFYKQFNFVVDEAKIKQNFMRKFNSFLFEEFLL